MPVYFYNYSWSHPLLFLLGPISIIILFYSLFDKNQIKKYFFIIVSVITFLVFIFSSNKTEQSLNWYLSKKLYFEESLQMVPQFIQKEKKPVVLLISADWCDSCEDLKKRLRQKEVAELINQGWLLVEVDLTDYEKQEEKIIKEWGVYGVPALVFYDSQGNLMKALTLVGSEVPRGTLISILRQFGVFPKEN